MSFSVAYMQEDFDSIQSDFGVSTTVPGTTTAVTAVRNSQDMDVVYTELNNKSVEYKFTLWYDTADFTAASTTEPNVHDEIIVDGTTYMVARKTPDPVKQIIAYDMVEQYG